MIIIPSLFVDESSIFTHNEFPTNMQIPKLYH